LFVLASVWDRYDWSESRLLRGRTFNIKMLGRSRPVHSTALAGGGLLIVMGALTAVVAFTGVAMPRRGWEATLTARLGHYGSVVSAHLSAIPGWLVLAFLLVALGGLIWKALGQYLDSVDDAEGHPTGRENFGGDDAATGDELDPAVPSPSPPKPQGARL
jgi:cytochrome c-type biogenesis protein